MVGIVAVDENMAIGLNNDLPWPEIKEDFKWFKEFTTGKCLAMGRKTYESIGILPDRFILVLTKNIPSNFLIQNKEKKYLAIYTSLILDLQRKADVFKRDLVVVGGAQIYKVLIPECTELYITHINGKYEADTYFPFSMDEINTMFPNSEVIREFEGGHKVVKYWVDKKQK